MLWRDAEPCLIVHRLQRSRAKEFTLFSSAPDQMISDAIDFIAAENADDMVDFGEFVEQCRAQSLRQTARHDDSLGFSRFLQVEHLTNDRFGFGAGTVDKSAGVDDDKVSPIGFADKGISIQSQRAEHFFAVDEIFRTPKGDEGVGPFRYRRRPVKCRWSKNRVDRRDNRQLHVQNHFNEKGNHTSRRFYLPRHAGDSESTMANDCSLKARPCRKAKSQRNRELNPLIRFPRDVYLDDTEACMSTTKFWRDGKARRTTGERRIMVPVAAFDDSMRPHRGAGRIRLRI